jgi:glycosyltransferase involved in cell wall biosynthesis
LNRPPKVSVCVVAYNQERYIEKCLRSLAGQITDFPFEVLVADDCSPDATRAAISRVVQDFPDLVIPRFNETNLGPTRNYLSVHGAARGEYVAHLDGDDFALPGKLQQQADYLDQHPECIAVVHGLANVDPEGQPRGSHWPARFSHPSYDLAQMVQTHPEFGHSSLMYRAGGYRALLERESMPEIIDFYLYAHLAAQGRIGVLEAVLGQYTQGVGMATRANLIGKVLEALDYAVQLGLPATVFRRAAAEQCHAYAARALNEGDLALFRSLIERSAGFQRLGGQQRLLHLVRGSATLCHGLRGLNRLRRALRG